MLRLTLLAVLLCLAGSQGSAINDQSLPLKPLDSRIINGEAAAPGEFPSQVSIRLSGTHLCGGSILNREWVLTGAHCVAANPIADISILAGTNDLEHGGTIHQVKSVIYHELYNSNDYWRNDIALVKVSKKFKLDGKLRKPIALPTQGQTTAEFSVATVIGWGQLAWGGARPTLLQKAGVQISNQVSCKAAYWNIGWEVHGFPTQICANSPDGSTGSCYGDSGSPLLVDGVMVGIVSWDKWCADATFPTIHTSVAGYRDWIKKHAGV